MDKIDFVVSPVNSLGIELELQLIHPKTFDLAAAADELLAQMADHPIRERVKPEITSSMIELNSSVHSDPMTLQTEMRGMRDALCEAADAVGVTLCGGGAHPFMRWHERAISDTPRFKYLAETYGYLARQFTVFGQHIHLGVASGDQAIALMRRLSPYVPHFIALSASSPYFEGIDTLFSCSRLNAVNSFPLAGHMPPAILDWYGFEAHIGQLRSFGLAESIKDLYWDIRPKPDVGTVELRICDTPLTVERASQLAAFAQMLAVLIMREADPPESIWTTYRSNHFQACRFGLQGSYVSADGERMRLIDHVRTTLTRLEPIADELGTREMLETLRESAVKQGTDARWMRNQFHRLRDLPGVVQSMAAAFRTTREAAAQTDLSSSVTGRHRLRAASEPAPDVQTLMTPEPGIAIKQMH